MIKEVFNQVDENNVAHQVSDKKIKAESNKLHMLLKFRWTVPEIPQLTFVKNTERSTWLCFKNQVQNFIKTLHYLITW